MDDLDALLMQQAQGKVPDALDSVLSARANAKPVQAVPNAALQGGTLSFGPLSLGIPTSPGVDQALAGVGSGLTDLWQGLKERFGKATPQDVLAKRATDANLRGTTAGNVGNFVGQALPALATLPIPALNTIGGAALTGAAMGAVQPTAPGESAAANVGLGALGGAAGQGAANLIGRAVAPIQSALSPADQQLANVLKTNGVPMDLAQATNSKPLRIVNSIFDNLPFTSGVEEAKRAAQQEAFNKAVLASTGTDATKATPEVIAGAYNRIGGVFNDLSKRNSINIDGPLVNDLFNTYDKYQKVLDANQRPLIGNTINDLLNVRGILPGETYQATRSTLGRLTKNADPNVVQAAKEIRTALDNAAERSLNGEDVAAWQQARSQYANLQPIAQAMKASNAVSGDIPPAQLRQALVTANPKNYVTGKGDLNDLARAGVRFLWNPIPNSGTAQRMLYQGLLTGSGLGLGTYYETGDPTKSLGVAAGGLLGPVVAQKALNSGLLGSYLEAGPTRLLVADEMKRLLGPALAGAGSVAARPQ